ncbi:MAG: DUF1385 domain-containing protein [Lachnospiraceae bacterium]|nr:DUF1385 domain-containing protein [Candidatus Colinaster equi]
MCMSGIGGQAVLEGVMMKNKDAYAVAVRKPDGEIDVEVEVFHGVAAGSKLSKVPFLRGVFAFIDSLSLGLRSLNHSASFYEDDTATETKADKAMGKIFGEKAEKVETGLVVALSFVIALALFMLLPYFLSTLLSKVIQNTSLIIIFEGIIRLIIFLLYIVAITAMNDIKRLYMYHGAEHKCINCIEHGHPLTVRNVKRASRFHKRCGTSFLLFVMIVSIIVFLFITVDNQVLKVVLRIALLPVIAGISYEIIHLAGKSDNIFIRIISAPGTGLQKLTTKEPDDDMIEVAIKSVEAVFDWRAFLEEKFDYVVKTDDGKEEE